MIFKSMFIQFWVRESFKVSVTLDGLIDAVMAVMPKACVVEKNSNDEHN